MNAFPSVLRSATWFTLTAAAWALWCCQAPVVGQTVPNPSVRPEPRAGQLREAVPLVHGMSRTAVFEQLGSPSFESVIVVLGRTRANYDDQLELLFEKQQLIAVKPASPPSRIEGGRLQYDLDDRRVVFDEILLLADAAPLLFGDDRGRIDDAFYWSDSIPGDDGLSIHFTPATSPWAVRHRRWFRRGRPHGDGDGMPGMRRHRIQHR